MENKFDVKTIDWKAIADTDLAIEAHRAAVESSTEAKQSMDETLAVMNESVDKWLK